MKKRIFVLGLIVAVITSITFTFGIFRNPTFNIHEFCLNMSCEIIGWVLAVTVFQYYADGKLELRNSTNSKINVHYSVADELLKLKALLDDEVLTQEEFDNAKKRLLSE